MVIPGDSQASLRPKAPCKSLLADPRPYTCFRFTGCLWLLLATVLAGPPATAQDSGQDSGISPSQAGRVAESQKDYIGARYRSNNTRDPFLNPLRNRTKPKQADREFADSRKPPGIGGATIDQLSFEGTSFRDNRRLAIIRGADKRAYFLEEGARFFDGYLKTILPDTIILVRETKLRSGKVLTQDVTRRLRK
jgi:hypothetical protein